LKANYANEIITVAIIFANSLSSEIVTAPSVNSFKNGLEKYWISQDIIYNIPSVCQQDA